MRTARERALAFTNTNAQTHKRTNAQTHKRTNARTHKRTNPQTHKPTNAQTHVSLNERIAQALSRVRNPRTGTDVLSSESVRDLATTASGKVRVTLLLADGDDPALARTVRHTLEQVEGVTEARVDVKDAQQAESNRRPAGRALPV